MIYLILIDDEKDKRKFIIIYEKYKYLLMTVAEKIIGDHHYAEDVVHEAFIKIAKNMKHIGDPESNKTKRYLITVTKNTAIDMYRINKVRGRMAAYVEKMEYCELPMSYFMEEEENVVLIALRKLPAQYRDIFLLKYSSELDNKEIAMLLNLTEGTVRQRIARGKVVLQEEIESIKENWNESY